MGHSLRRRAAGLLLALVTLFGAIAAPWTGLNCKLMDTYAAEDYHYWRQYDPRWSSTLLGGSTLGSVGCYITSIQAQGTRTLSTPAPSPLT